MHRFRFLMILPMLAAAGCQIVQQKMPVPPALQSVPPLQVERAGPLWLNGLMKAGDWTIRDISIGPQTHRCSHHLFSVDSIDTQSYAFTVASQNNPLRGACEFKSGARFYRWNDEPEEPGYRPKLECKYHGFSEGNLLLESQEGTRNGSVAFGAPAWDIRAVYDDSGFLASSSLVGYEIWSGATAIAAVETVGDGRIWIDPSLPKEDQQRVIGVAATLVLYDPPPRSAPDDCQ